MRLPLPQRARTAIETLTERAQEIRAPSIRLGVTGLSRSGKTVFLTALVHNLVHGGRLPLFRPVSEGRVSRAYLEPQPDDQVPRFAYEDHVAALVDARVWPRSTRRVSELRVTIEYESASYLSRRLGPGKLHLDLIDYPGEWLLDLPLLSKDFATFSEEALAEAHRPAHRASAAPWLTRNGAADPFAKPSEATATELAAAFTAYLRAVRAEPTALAALPPGRFHMPGDLEGSPALTFAPLTLPSGRRPGHRSLWGLMERRYEAYKTHVVRPFFQDHFARLDRQIVLVDVLSALNGGRPSVAELRRVLAEVLACFRVGRLGWLSALVDRKIDKILFAASKADHVHQEDHDRLEAILSMLVDEAKGHAAFSGAEVAVTALAAVRATRQATLQRNGTTLPTIVGTPMPGERLNGTAYDGETEIALFPGDLPSDPAEVLEEGPPGPVGVNYLRFRPPRIERSNTGLTLSLPHVRLDRALQYLIGDRLQ